MTIVSPHIRVSTQAVSTRHRPMGTKWVWLK